MRRRRANWGTKRKRATRSGIITPTGQANLDIENLLMARHLDDVVIKEAMSAKGGQFDAGVTRRRLDFWVVRVSWRKPSYIGYEVKCSRADFIADKKTQHYEGQCTQFVWVTAQGVVKSVDEIPEGHGWQELSKSGTQLTTRKMPPDLEVDHAQLFNAMKSSLMRKLKS